MLVVFLTIRITLHEILLLLENIMIQKMVFSMSLLVYHFSTKEYFYCDSFGWNKPIDINSYIEEIKLSTTNKYR